MITPPVFSFQCGKYLSSPFDGATVDTIGSPDCMAENAVNCCCASQQSQETSLDPCRRPKSSRVRRSIAASVCVCAAASDPPSPRGEESQATTLRKNAAGKIAG